MRLSSVGALIKVYRGREGGQKAKEERMMDRGGGGKTCCLLGQQRARLRLSVRLQ